MASRAAMLTRVTAHAARRSLTMDTRAAGTMVRSVLESNSGYRHRHGLDVPGSREADPLERAMDISGSGAFANMDHVASTSSNPDPQLVMSSDRRYHSSFPLPIDNEVQSARGLLDCDWAVRKVRNMSMFGSKSGPMVVEGENQERPMTGAATKSAVGQFGSSLSRRSFSSMSASAAEPTRTSPKHNITPLEDAFTADESDIAKAGTSNYRSPTTDDHLYSNIPVSQGVSSDLTTASMPAGPNLEHTIRKEMRDVESPKEKVRVPTATAPRASFDLDRPTDEFFPENPHLEPAAVENLAHQKTRYSAVSSSLKSSSSFYPDTMILESEVKQAIPAEGLPKLERREGLRENLHQTAGYFPDSNVTDPVEVSKPLGGIRKM